MYGWTSWHQGRPDQKTQVCDSPRMAWNGGRGETEWPISPAGNPFLPREALQMLISKDLETLCLMPFFYLLHAVFLLDLLTLFHICYSNSGENLGKSSSVCLFCPNLAPKTDENFSQWWWCSLQDISLMPTSSSPPPPPRRPTRPLPKMRGPITNSPSGPIGSNLLLPFDLLPKLDCTLKPTITPAGKIAFGTHWFFLEIAQD